MHFRCTAVFPHKHIQTVQPANKRCLLLKSWENRKYYFMQKLAQYNSHDFQQTGHRVSLHDESLHTSSSTTTEERRVFLHTHTPTVCTTVGQQHLKQLAPVVRQHQLQGASVNAPRPELIQILCYLTTKK